MRIELRVAGGVDAWRSEPENVLRVCLSAAFPILDGISSGEVLPVVVEPSESEADSPIALVARSSTGERRILLPVRDNRWTQLAFQFAHEFAHHVADATTLPASHFMWIEEALCETASLFSLRATAAEWAAMPPYPNWRAEAPSFAAYAEDRVRAPEHTLPHDVPFEDWLRSEQSSLQAHSGQREKNTIIAKELLPIFEQAPLRWRALRTIHRHPGAGNSDPDVVPFLRRWAPADGDSGDAIPVIARALGFD